jgi:hypothetical protein
MSEQWLLQSEAIELVCGRLKSSIGRAQALVRSATESGEVRSRIKWVPVEDDDVLVDVEDAWLDVDPVPRHLAMAQAADHPKAVTARIRVGGNRLEKQISTYSCSDLIDWLERQPQVGVPVAVQRAPTTKRSAEKTDRAKRVAVAIWGDGGPPSHLPNKSIYRAVMEWLKNHSEPQDISEKVIRRAVGRK